MQTVTPVSTLKRARHVLFVLGSQRIFKLHNLLWLVLLIPIVPRLFEFSNHTWQVLNWDWQIDFDEGVNLNAALKLSQGTNIYARHAYDSFIGAPYPPLFYLLNATFLKIFGLNIWSGRLISLLASGAIAVLIYLFSARLQTDYFKVGVMQSRIVAGLAALSWLAVAPVIIWSNLYKQDMLAIALGTAGLWFAWSWDRLGGKKRMGLSLLLLTLGFYVKQTELLAALVALTYFVLANPFRKGWKFGTRLLLLLVVPFVLINVLTQGGFFFKTITTHFVLEWSPKNFERKVLERLLPDHWPLLVAGATFGLVELGRALRQWRAGRWCRPHVVVIWLGAGVASLYTVGGMQNNYNHSLNLFPPLIVAASGVVGWVIAQMAAGFKAGPHRKLRLAVVAAVGLGLVWGWSYQWLNYANTGIYYTRDNMPSVARQQLYEGLVRQIVATPGDVLSEDAYLQLKAGRPIIYDDIVDMTVLHQSRHWNENRFLQDLRDRRFSLILLELEWRRFSGEGWDTLKANYRLTFPNHISLWRARPQPLKPQYAINCKVGPSFQFKGASYYHEAQAAVWRITTYWQTENKPDRNYIFYVHLVDKNGQVVFQRDESPNGYKLLPRSKDLPTDNGQPLPTTSWLPNEQYLIDQSLALPPEVANRTDLQPVIGAYYVNSGGTLEELPIKCGDELEQTQIGLPRISNK